MTGGSSQASCIPCDDGKYCQGLNNTQPTGDCLEGYFCQRNSTHGNKQANPNNSPIGGLCPAGRYCPIGTSIPKECDGGLYSNGTGASQCLECPEGFECLGSPSYPKNCRQGYFCRRGEHPESNKGLPVPCDIGTFGERENLASQSECTPCLAGKYCSTKGLTNFTGLCAAGYWCKSGAKARFPDEEDGKYGSCPTGGFYCPEGSEEKLKCPQGRYSPVPNNKLKSPDECTPCPGGKYCEMGNQVTVTGDCSEGYYCLPGSSTKEPNSTHGGICPPGTYCIAGSSSPSPCEAGTYNDIEKQPSCKTCLPGFYCPVNSTNPIPCPAGYWCESGAKAAFTNPCPPGTFNNVPQQSDRSDCKACTPGYYCQESGMKNFFVDH